MRSSTKPCRAAFFIRLTAWIIISALISIFNAVDMVHLLPFIRTTDLSSVRTLDTRTRKTVSLQNQGVKKWGAPFVGIGIMKRARSMLDSDSSVPAAVASVIFWFA